MEQQYQWAVRIVRENLDGNGGVEDTYDEVQPCKSEVEARTRCYALLHHLNFPGRAAPKYERIARAELLRRPVSEWETVEQ